MLQKIVQLNLTSSVQITTHDVLKDSTNTDDCLFNEMQSSDRTDNIQCVRNLKTTKICNVMYILRFHMLKLNN